MNAIAILVNPMSGRDVRRIAARASFATHESKMDMVARVAAGADAIGVKSIYVTREPFRICTRALEWMPLRAHVHVLDFPIRNTDDDTATALARFRQQGVRTIVSLGGDGTHRIIARTGADVDLIPLSTGTNNVFPSQTEPTIAGMVAAWAARGVLGVTKLKRKTKILRVDLPDGSTDVALIDAVKLENDVVGNMLPFNTENIRELVLTRAHASGIGMTSIGGLLRETSEKSDHGLYLKMGVGTKVRAAISPGLFEDVSVAQIELLGLSDRRWIRGPGILAFDGDRLHRLGPSEQASVTLVREGPYVYDIEACMSYAVANGLTRKRSNDSGSRCKF